MERRKLLNLLLSFSGALILKPTNIIGEIGNEHLQTRAAAITKVHLIFKTHLDIGFTDLAENVINSYIDHFIPRALSLAVELRKNNCQERFIWTTGSWLIYEYLKRASYKSRNRMEEAIYAGDIVWHGLPFTTHSELMDDSLFTLATKISAELDKRFGKKTIAAKMTDVPSHSIGIVPPLQKAGISFLHIGINPSSTPPDVPPLFIWRVPDGSEVITMYQSDYGSIMVIPGTHTAVAIKFTGDNHGPQSLDSIREIYSDLQQQFPNALIVASTLNKVAEDLNKIHKNLPVVTQELGDTWIHGVASDPWKISRFRELCRLRKAWLKNGEFSLGDSIDFGFGLPLLMIAEHTWGLDVKSFLQDWGIYRVNELAVARSKENFQKMETSWKEKRSYLNDAMLALPEKLAQQAHIACDNLEPRLPQMDGFQRLNVRDIEGGIETTRFIVALDANSGAINKLIDKMTGRNWSSPNNPLGLFTYQTFSKDDFERFQDQYLTQKPNWAIADFGKPGIENINLTSNVWFASMRETWVQKNKEGISLLIKSEVLDHKGEAPGGCPKLLVTNLVFPDDSSTIRIDFQCFDKPANRLPEALWYSFVPRINQPGKWLLNKMGMNVNPLDVIKNGNRKLHGVIDGVCYQEKHHSFYIDTLDCPLVAPGERSLLNFNNKLAGADEGMHFCLYNNVWGTNFVMWFEDNMRYRFQIKI
ncbi:DUF5054 domain-containing protein [candidate division KSB1 bacterium]|nr:DUF5054 domain-containing protein [candidate division KSB1 bacterium]